MSVQKYPTLDENIKTDVVIVGGGITGVVSSYLLANEGLKVVLLEKDTLGTGATKATTAFITQSIDTSLSDLVDMYGEDKARKVWESGAAAIELIENIVNKEKIDCNFSKCSANIFAERREDLSGLKEDQKVAKRIGFETTIKKDDKLGFSNYGYWEIPDQAKFYASEYLPTLAKLSVKNGAKIYENTEAWKVNDGAPIKVRTDKGTVTANYLISATYRPFENIPQLFAKKGMYVSYVIGAKIEKGKIPEAIYWNRHNPYYYFRIDSQKNSDYITLGGADHREELPLSEEKNYKALKNYIHELLGDIDYKIDTQWKGPILEPSDGLALIGKTDENKLLASAFSGNGMTYSHIAGMIFADIIQGRKNEWVDVYDPLRTLQPKALLKKGLDYVEEFFGGAVKNTFNN